MAQTSAALKSTKKHQLDRTRRTKHKTFKTPRTQRTRLSDKNTKPLPQ